MALTKQISANVQELQSRGREQADQRVVRTRGRLDAAFVTLLHRRAYGSIRVSDIAKKAGVGRATFYAHYSSKDDLLRSQFRRVVAPMLAATQGDICPLDASALFHHVITAPQIYKALMAGSNAGSGPKILRECFEKRVREVTRVGEGNASAAGLDLRKKVIPRFVASSLFAVIECWLESEARESPRDVQEIFRGVVGGGLAGMGRKWAV